MARFFIVNLSAKLNKPHALFTVFCGHHRNRVAWQSVYSYITILLLFL